MKVLIVNKFLYPNGGSETYIFEIGRKLKELGHEVQYFGMEHEGRIAGNRIGCYTQNMDFHNAGMMEKIKYPLLIIHSKEAAEKITEVLQDFHPDVVHFNNINFQLTPSVIEAVHAFDPKIRMVYTAHDYQWVCPNHMLKIPATGELCTRCIDGDFSFCIKNRCIHGSRARSILGAKEGEYYKKRGTYGLIDTVICPSRFMEGMLSHNPQLQGKTVVIHNFLPDMKDEKERTKKEDTGEESAKQGKIKEDTLREESTGRDSIGEDSIKGDSLREGGLREDSSKEGSIREDSIGEDSSKEDSIRRDAAGESEKKDTDKGDRREKKPYVLYFGRYDKEKGILTFLKAARALPDIPFVIAGKGEYQDKVEEAAKACPNIKEVGFLTGKALQDTIEGAAFTVFPSEWYENCPFAVVESQLSGTPVLASDLGGTPELLIEGVTGETFKAGDAKVLKEKIRGLYKKESPLSSYKKACSTFKETGIKSLGLCTLEEYCRRLVGIYRGAEG